MDVSKSKHYSFEDIYTFLSQHTYPDGMNDKGKNYYYIIYLFMKLAWGVQITCIIITGGVQIIQGKCILYV